MLLASCNNDEFIGCYDDFREFDFSKLNQCGTNVWSELKPIESKNQLLALISYLENQYGVVISDSLLDYDTSQELTQKKSKIQRKKTNSPEGASDVVISKVDDNGRMEVYLNISTPAVTNSCFYNNSIWDAFFGYEHNGGSAWNEDDNVYFEAHGTFIIKLVTNGIVLKRLPTGMRGYYNRSSKSGAIVN